MIKHHSEPEMKTLNQNVPGGMNHFQKPGFNWKKATARALQKQYYRSIQLARTNITYQLEHPNECRDNPDHKLLDHCHPEAQKRILEKHEKILSQSVVPVVDRPVRLNRNG